MVDREKLKRKAKSAGKSIAGTLGEGAKRVKDTTQSIAERTGNSSGETVGIEVEYDNQNDEYVVLADGQPFATYDSRKQAMKAARAAIRDRQRRMDESDSSTGASETSEPGKIQQFATSFADSVDETIAGATASDDDNSDQEDTEGGADLSFLTGGQTDDKTTEPALPFMGESGGESETEPELPFMGNTDSEQSQPALPFMGGQESDEEPQVPMFGGMENDGPGMAFGFGGSEDMEMNGFGFGPSESAESEDGDQPPWMF